MRALLTVGLLLASLAGHSQAQAPITFSFKGILLNSSYSDFPSSYKVDCTPISKDKTFFCLKGVEVGSVLMHAEFYFKQDRLADIEAYFPSDKFDLVILALVKKYGKEQKWDAKQYVWRSSALSIEAPPPDELTVLRVAQSEPIDCCRSIIAAGAGKVWEPDSWSVLRYESMQEVRDRAAERTRKQDREVGDVSKEL